MVYRTVNGKKAAKVPYELTMGGRIDEQLKAHHMSQADLGRVIGVSKMTVSQWVNNESLPRPESLLNIAFALFKGDVLFLVHGERKAPKGGFPTTAGNGPQETEQWRKNRDRSSAR